MNRKTAAALLTILIGLGLIPGPSAAGQPQGRHIDVQVSQRVDDRWGVSRAARLWNAEDAGQAKIRVCFPCVNPDVTISVTNKPGASWVGMAWMREKGRGRVVLNYGVANAPRYRPYNQELRFDTALHELGHILGLDHTRHGVMGSHAWWTGGRVYQRDRDQLRRNW